VDWRTWHDEYDDPDSWMARRLRVVQHWIRTVLDDSPPGPLRVVSLCAGQGRDLLEVLADHPRRDDVRALLVELDPRNTAVAEEAAADLPGVTVLTADASLTDHYRGMVPADLVLVCGVFGNITAEDIRRTTGFCTQLCRTGGTVIWTRHREPPDLVPAVCAWFEERGFARRWVSDPGADFGVGVHRFTGEPRPLAEDTRMFAFIGYDRLHT
jgi:hypothetical protein